jgi:uncharacterized repeat protein (TIGR01451 family)
LMEEVRRVPTTKEKKKSTTLLIILAALLGVALIGTAVYFYTTGETTEPAVTTETTCACYYIDPAVISECGDPRRGFLFELETVPSDQACRASCSVNNLSPNLLNSNTEQELYQICPLQVVQDSRCNEMTVTDSAGKIVTGKVGADDEITIEAKFDQEYSEHKFIINNQEIEPDTVSPDNLTITKTYTDLSASTLNIFATATDKNGNQINSPVCRRLIEIDQEGVADLSDIQIDTRKDAAGIYKVSSIKIGIGNISEEDVLKIRFSFDKDSTDLLMNEGFTVDVPKGEITILEQDLYNSENFGTDLTFSQFDGLEGKFEVTAEVSTEEEVIGTVQGILDLPKVEEVAEEEATVEEEAEESKFLVSKTSNVDCVERVSPNNIAQFTLTTNNQGTVAQNITSVKDKLPLGFTYVENSSQINGTSVSDDDYVSVTNVGDTQEVVWEKEGGWSIDAGQSLTILFQSQADENALTGENQNEVVVTPAEVPDDPESLRAEAVITVAQSCKEPEETPTTEPEEEDETEEVVEEEVTTPDTGIFDSVVGRIILGILVVVTGWYIYSKPMGQALVEKFVQSGLYKEAEIASWRIFKPKKFFETKVVRKLDKKKKKD